jgi:hypothetical protein
MIEVVVAVYKTADAAETAIADLEAARVPATTIRQLASNPAMGGELFRVPNPHAASGDRAVVVTVDERHARLVLDILDMRAPAMMTEAPLHPA